jgi:hypothetical protein
MSPHYQEALIGGIGGLLASIPTFGILIGFFLKSQDLYVHQRSVERPLEKALRRKRGILRSAG